MSATQPLLNHAQSDHIRTILQTLLEAPPASLDLLLNQISSQQPPSDLTGPTPAATAGSMGDLLTSPLLISSLAIELIHTWPTSDKAAFIHGHPRIGEQSNLSAMSAAEQAKYATPPEVLERLAVLNQEYERIYPGLRYITFVAGRTRAQIVTEMEELLGLLPDEEPNGETPAPYAPGDEEWEDELTRAINDIGRIAQDRATKMH